MKNVWDHFFRNNPLGLTRNTPWIDWEGIISSHRNDFGLRLVALAWYEVKTGKPLGTSEKESNIEQVSSDVLGFNYSGFTNNREVLGVQLEHLGFRLLRTYGPRGPICQYVRTIHRYSGGVFLKTAARARLLTPSKWLVGENGNELNQQLAEIAARYAEESERKELLADVRDFWARMRKRYRLYNAAPSLERCAAEESDIPVRVLERILKTLWPEEEAPEEMVHDSVPVFRLDAQGRPALGLPNNPRFSANENVNLICFVCRDKEENFLKSIRFHLSDGAWQAEQAGDSVPLVNVGRVVRQEFHANPGLPPERLSEQDVTPSALADSDYILFSLHNGQIKPVDLETPLNNGQRYIIAPLSGEMPGIQALDDSETAAPVTTDAMGYFTLPNDAVSLQIGDNQYSVKTNIFQWLDIDSRFQNIRNPGARLFFTQGTHLLTDSCIETESMGARYLMSDGEIVDLPNLAKGEVPAAILWDRGKLEFFDLNTQERFASRATTFLPPIEAGELGVPMELQHVDPAHVMIGNVQIEVAVPDWCDKVEFTYHSVTFRFPLQRKGITMKLPSKDGLVELQSSDKSLKMLAKLVARNDFDSAVFSFLLPDEQRTDGALEVDQGTREKLIARFTPIPKRLRGSEIKIPVGLNLLEDTSRRRFSTWTPASSAMVGDIVLYSPEQESVSQVRDGFDLVCKLPIAWKWSQRQLILVFFPGHQLDATPTIIDADEADFIPQAGTNLQATIRFTGLYGRKDIDWGPGLHAFIARRDKTRSEGMATITPLFNIQRPTELGEWDGSCSDGDPYGLRKAMAQNDLCEIDKIMQSSDEEHRNYVRQFEDRTFTAWNSINCVKACPAYQVGYFFMADWWLHEKAMTSSRNTFVGCMNENYRRLWSPLMTTNVPQRELNQIAGIERNFRWANAHQFNEPDCGDICREFRDLVWDVENYLHEIAPNFHASRDDPTFNISDAMVPIANTRYNQYDLEKCLSRLGKAVALWRLNPTCNGAQPLRDFLLRVENMDNRILNQPSCIGMDGRPNRFSLTDRIALKAWVLRAQ